MDSQFISDLFAPFGPVAVRRMFGGAGLYRDGLMFALEFDGVIVVDRDGGRAHGTTSSSSVRGPASAPVVRS